MSGDRRGSAGPCGFFKDILENHFSALQAAGGDDGSGGISDNWATPSALHILPLLQGQMAAGSRCCRPGEVQRRGGVSSWNLMLAGIKYFHFTVLIVYLFLNKYFYFQV